MVVVLCNGEGCEQAKLCYAGAGAYELYAAVFHRGWSTVAGHYFAAVKVYCRAGRRCHPGSSY
jgi:uncharacterized UBP type Zn finger protein